MRIVNPFRRLEYYKSIDDMPIYNWFKIQETNDVSWMLLKKRSINGYESIELREALQIVTDQYMDTFGISDEYRKIMRLTLDIRSLEIDFFTTQDRSHLTFIELKKTELKNIAKKSKTADSISVQVHIEKYMGRKINLRETTVKEFYNYLQEMKKEFKAKSKIK